MRAVGTILIVCGIVIIVATAWELATNSLTTPTQLFTGPLFLIGGIFIRANKKDTN